ncbi:MAG TPA: hypothetical protein PLC48_09210 [Ferruginibacter sp.]|nr:hypothetical protein [Ferruginibacter sp.]
MKLKGIYTIIPAILGLLAISSCYYDKADLLYPAIVSGCDTANAISYTQKVVPILQQQCYSCHQAPGGSGGIDMGTYDTDKAIAIDGKLHGSISYAPGYSPMPEGAPRLTDCQIATIKKWIDENSPNN